MSLPTGINGLAQIYFITYLPMAFVVPWMFVKYGLRTTLIIAASLNAVGSVAKYAVSFASPAHTVLALTYVAQGIIDRYLFIDNLTIYERSLRTCSSCCAVVSNIVRGVVVWRQRTRTRQHDCLHWKSDRHGCLLDSLLVVDDYSLRNVVLGR